MMDAENIPVNMDSVVIAEGQETYIDPCNLGDKELLGDDAQLPATLTLKDMPEEILEHILSFLSPYEDMEAAKQVSRQWNRVIKSTIKQKKRKFYQSLGSCDIQWTEIYKEKPPSFSERGHIGISDRFSHSTAYHNGLMYVFGGCTATNTTFNDLWTFDLTHRRWVRPVAMGTYPSPKACATMVVYNGNLVLFGGWSHPIPYPLHQSAHYFSELHVYSPANNRWSHVHSLGQEPEALGGHSASVAGHLMVVFGGSPRPGSGTNNLWVFNFQKASWTLQPVCSGSIPEPRYGQFQTTLDDSHILIMGGCVGQNRIYTDVWLLTLEASGPWKWSKLTVECPELGAPQTWCHAVCRVKDMIVVVAKSSSQRSTKQVKRVKRKHTHHRHQEAHSSGSQPTVPSSATSPSTLSSTSSSPSTSAAASAAESVTTCQSPSPGVYVHPKLKPQPKRQADGRRAENTTNSNNEEGAVFDSIPSSSRNLSAATASNASTNMTSDINPSNMTLLAASAPSSSSGQSLAKRLPANRLVTQGSGSRTGSLLALQQRLHRECLNLPDPDNHHSRGQSHGFSSDDDQEMPEGYIHRLQNRYLESQSAAVSGGGTGQQQNDLAAHAWPEGGAMNSRVSLPPTSSSSLATASACASASSDHPNSQAVDVSSDEAAGTSQRNLHSPPQVGALQHQTSRPTFHQPFRSMPSVRPNAMYNRQRQLEALQRQEALLMSRSHGLLANRGSAQRQHQHHQNQVMQQQQPQHHQQEEGQASPARERNQNVQEQDMKGCVGGDNDDVLDSDSDHDDGRSSPVIVPTKNKMDVHILDISGVLDSGVVRWKPLSEFQPGGAPDETICCSLVPGRAEVALFGGVRRSGPSNMAIGRLFLLHP